MRDWAGTEEATGDLEAALLWSGVMRACRMAQTHAAADLVEECAWSFPELRIGLKACCSLMLVPTAMSPVGHGFR